MKAGPERTYGGGVAGAARRPRRVNVLVLFFLAVFGAGAAHAEGAKPDHAPWGHLLAAYLKAGAPGEPNLIDYAVLKAHAKDHAALKAYIASLETIDPQALPDAERFAFWVNLYNALTVDVVTDHYPVASIRDISISPGLFSKGPWGRKLVTVMGRDLSLDDIEHGILRPEFKDARIHYAVNCAARGCPNLAPRPYSGADLDAMLDEAARGYINSPRGARIEAGKLTASRIFDWYMEDFGGTEAGVLEEIRKYAGPGLREKLENITAVSSYDYDWALNDAAPATPPEERE